MNRDGRGSEACRGDPDRAMHVCMLYECECLFMCVVVLWLVPQVWQG